MMVFHQCLQQYHHLYYQRFIKNHARASLVLSQVPILPFFILQEPFAYLNTVYSLLTNYT